MVTSSAPSRVWTLRDWLFFATRQRRFVAPRCFCLEEYTHTGGVGDVAPDFGLRRVMGKGGHEVPVALPAPARAILREYMATERAGLPATAPLFVVTYKNRAGQCIERRITGQRIWKIAKAVGARAGLSALHPHALRHACGAELLRRSKNLRVVQEQLRHVDVQSTTGHTRLMQQDVREALENLGNEGE